MSVTLVALPTTGESFAETVRKRIATCRKFGTNYDLRHVWRSGDHAVELWAKTSGRAGNENKSELPPPVAEALYYGPIYIVKADRRTTAPSSFTLGEWKAFYNEQFGGFDDLDEDESSSEDELDSVDPNLLTEDGYLKDGFVVDSSDVDDGDGTDSASEPEAVSSDSASSDPDVIPVAAGDTSENNGEVVV